MDKGIAVIEVLIEGLFTQTYFWIIDVVWSKMGCFM